MIKDMKLITREEWIAALRSGKYEQGEGAMKDGDSFCCLGVACDLAGMKWDEVKQPEQSKSSSIVDFLHNVYDQEGEEFGYKLVSALGISFSQGALAIKNDRGDSFLDIADALERGED